MTDLSIPATATPVPADETQDLAWASFHSPLTPAAVAAFCQDIERLFRINPFLEFRSWRRSGDNRYRFRGRNLSQQPGFDFDLELEVEPLPDGLHIRYAKGLKRSTTLRIEAEGGGSKLTILEDYGGMPEAERSRRLHEVDRSLATWAGDLERYLRTWKRIGWLAPWRWYMRHVWQPMKPASRRITYMLLWISFAEVMLVLLGAGIYWAEHR